MPDLESLRLMSNLNICEKHSGKNIRKISSVFRGNYITGNLLVSILCYCLLFSIFMALYYFVNFNSLVENFDNFTAEIISKLNIFLIGLGIVAITGYTFFLFKYEREAEDGRYYKAMLDMLIRLNEGEKGDFEVDKNEFKYYDILKSPIKYHNKMTGRTEIIKNTIKPVYNKKKKRG